MQTTRWVDNKTKIFEEAINLLTDEKQLDESSDIGIIYTNWDIQKVFSTNEEIKLNGRDIKFNYIFFSYDSISPGEQPIEDRTTRRKGFIIPYFNGISVNYIISRNSDAMQILRKLLGYSGKKEIEKNIYDINSDIFVWLIKKVYDYENVLEDEEEEGLKQIKIDAIKGFKGDSDDLLTKVSADGETVMNIISTLSFLLESKNLNQIKLDVEYSTHRNIELTLNNKGTIATSNKNYIGDFDTGQEEKDAAKLYLLIYLELLPLIVQIYQMEKENDDWNKEKYIDFLKKVADNLSERVANKISALNK